MCWASGAGVHGHGCAVQEACRQRRSTAPPRRCSQQKQLPQAHRLGAPCTALQMTVCALEALLLTVQMRPCQLPPVLRTAALERRRMLASLRALSLRPPPRCMQAPCTRPAP